MSNSTSASTRPLTNDLLENRYVTVSVTDRISVAGYVIAVDEIGMVLCDGRDEVFVPWSSARMVMPVKTLLQEAGWETVSEGIQVDPVWPQQLVDEVFGLGSPRWMDRPPLSHREARRRLEFMGVRFEDLSKTSEPAIYAVNVRKAG